MHAPATFPDVLVGVAHEEPSEAPPPTRENTTNAETDATTSASTSARSNANEAAAENKSFAASLLGEGPAEPRAAWRDGARKFGVALALSAAYGLAIGTRDGGLSILKHAAAVPLAPLAVVDPPAAVGAAARGAATTGLVLGGLAPAMALFVTTSSSRLGAAFCAGMGLILAGIFGLRAFLSAIGAPLARASVGVRTVSGFALAGFAVFGTALAARVWWSTLPLFGGAP
jgi:hypothetical protein